MGGLFLNNPRGYVSDVQETLGGHPFDPSERILQYKYIHAAKLFVVYDLCQEYVL